MERINRWIKGTNEQWIFYTYDNSPMEQLEEKVDTDMIYFSVNEEPVNLGIISIIIKSILRITLEFAD
jgi:hypothetical protein